MGYQQFIKNSAYFKSKKRKRKRSRSHSNATDPGDMNREYIPLIIAVNKCEINKKKKQFKKKDIKKVISKKLQPIIDENFPNLSDIEDDDEDNDHDTNNEDDTAVQHKHFTNATLLQPPNLTLVYDEGDDEHKGSDSETDGISDVDMDSDDDTERKRIKVNHTSSDLLSIAYNYH